MILISTLRKMGDKPVYIVSVPAYTFTAVGRSLDIPAVKEVFATKRQAIKYANDVDPHKFGATESPVLSSMTATAYLKENW